MKKSKFKFINRIVCFLLSGCLLSTAVFCSYDNSMKVYAESTGAEIAKVICAVAISALNVVVPESAIATPVLSYFADKGINYIDHLIYNDDGSVTVDEELVSAIDEVIDKDRPQFTSIPVGVPSELFSKNVFQYPGQFDATMALVNSHSLAILDSSYSKWGYTLRAYNNLARYFVAGSVSSYDKYISTGVLDALYVVPYGSGIIKNPYACVDIYNYSSSTNTYNFSKNDTYLSGDSSTWNYVSNSWGSGSIMVFRTEQDLRKLLNGVNYYGTKTYSGGSVTLPSSALTYDYDGLRKKISDDVNTLDNPSADEIQNIVDDTLDNFNNDIYGGSGGNTDSGSDEPSWGWSALLDGLGKLLDGILAVIGKLLEYIGKAIELFSSLVDKALNIIPKGFTDFLAGLFPFIPEEVWIPIELMLGLSVILMLFFAFKK